jgi:hypothetical protein
LGTRKLDTNYTHSTAERSDTCLTCEFCDRITGGDVCDACWSEFLEAERVDEEFARVEETQEPN